MKVKWKWKSFSHVWLFAIPWTVAHQAPLCIDSTGKNTGVIPFSRGSFWPRDWTQVSCTAGRFFTIWATRKAKVKGIVFPVIMYGCESWTVKKAECQIIDAFKLWCWRRFLRVPWTAGKSNQSTLKEINPESSLEGLRLKLKLQYFGHQMQRADLLEKTLMLWKKERGMTRGWEGWMASPMLLRHNEHEFEWTLGVVDGQGGWHAAVYGVAKSQTRLSDWPELNWLHRLGLSKWSLLCFLICCLGLP